MLPCYLATVLPCYLATLLRIGPRHGNGSVHGGVVVGVVVGLDVSVVVSVEVCVVVTHSTFSRRMYVFHAPWNITVEYFHIFK